MTGTRSGLILKLPDGRRLGYAEFGDPAGFPVVYCHGFPASRLEGGLVAEAARRQGLRLIAIDRPGYGLSDWQERRRLLDWPDDVAALLAFLWVDRFAVLGVSGGGPYALALLAKLAGRINAASLVCPLGPVFRDDLAQAMHWPGRLGFTSARRAPWLNQAFYGRVLGPLMRSRPALALSLLTLSSPPADRTMLARAEVKQILCASIREALRPGMRGALRDFQIYAHDWGFDPAAIALDVAVWHGDADATVPVSHGQALAALLPNADLRILPGEGHFSLPIGQADAILNLLRAQASKAA